MVDLALWRTPLIASVNVSALFAGAAIIGALWPCEENA